MAHLLAMVFAPLELDDLDLWTAAVTFNFCRHLGAVYKRGTQGDVVAISNHQHFRNFDIVAFSRSKFLDF